MTSDKYNLNFEKTSFLQGGNSPFIKDLYLKYLSNPKSIPQSWADFFDGLNESEETVKNELLGPSWSPRKKLLPKDNLAKEINPSMNKDSFPQKKFEKEKEQSVKAIALIRAYRIRGHLIANLDPLGMMERKYLNELHPADHGFKKEDYN